VVVKIIVFTFCLLFEKVNEISFCCSANNLYDTSKYDSFSRYWLNYC